MRTPESHLTPAEWHLMECLWEKGSVSGREAVEYLHDHVGWSRSTTLTLLRRMTEKGMLLCKDEDRIFHYYPNIRREEAVMLETDNFLNRVYHGSLAQMLVTLSRKTPLSQQEIDELRTILQQAEEVQEQC